MNDDIRSSSTTAEVWVLATYWKDDDSLHSQVFASERRAKEAFFNLILADISDNEKANPDCWTLEQIVANGDFDAAFKVAFDYYSEIDDWQAEVLPCTVTLPVPLPNPLQDGLAVAVGT